MDGPLTSIDAAIKDLEAERDKIDHTLRVLAEARNLLSHRTSSVAIVESASASEPPFGSKFGRTAKELVLEALQESEGPRTSGEIRSRLTDQGAAFSKQAISVALLDLLKSGTIVRQKAEAGSGAQYAYTARPRRAVSMNSKAFEGGKDE